MTLHELAEKIMRLPDSVQQQPALFLIDEKGNGLRYVAVREINEIMSAKIDRETADQLVADPGDPPYLSH